ncbi:MAG TPA: siderophore-interacting protein [Rhizomicrobium sp.]
MDKQEQNTGLLQSVGAFIARKGRRVWPLTVTNKERIAPRMTRVAFIGSDLDELVWKQGQDVVLEIPCGEGFARRHYTIRHHDAQLRTLTIDFVLHGEGVSGPWLDALWLGDSVNAVGPRGHTMLNIGADWHLFSGDETCIPGIFAMIEALPKDARAFAFIEIGSDADRLTLTAQANAYLTWLSRDSAVAGPSRIVFDAIEKFELPQGRGHAYVIGETSNVRSVRHRLLERGFGRDQICAEGYWRPGRVGGHDHV